MSSSYLPARYEFKYRLGAAETARLLDEVAPFTRADGHSARSPDGRYLVRSLYFDTPTLACYHGKLAGLHERIKVRLRRYGETDAPGEPVFLEVKRKEGPFVRKARIRLPADAPVRADGQTLLRWLRVSWRPDLDDPNQRAVWRSACWPGLRPVALVTYRRHARISLGPHPVRITADYNVSGRSATRLLPYNGGFRLRPALPGVVLELKFQRAMPSWLMHVVQRHNLECQAVSKYCLVMEASAPLFDHAGRGTLVDEGLSWPAPALLYHAPRGGGR